MSAQIDAATQRLSELTVARRKRLSSPWTRWLKDRAADETIAELQRRRETLRSQSHGLAQARLRAGIEVRDVRIEHARATVQAAADRDAALKAATQRQAIIARAKRLLAAVPMLAYVGVRRLLAMATRIERAREQGYDPGPTTRIKVG